MEDQEYMVLSHYTDGSMSTAYVKSLEEAYREAEDGKLIVGSGFDYAIIAKVVDFVEGWR